MLKPSSFGCTSEDFNFTASAENKLIAVHTRVDFSWPTQTATALFRAFRSWSCTFAPILRQGENLPCTPCSPLTQKKAYPLAQEQVSSKIRRYTDHHTVQSIATGIRQPTTHVDCVNFINLRYVLAGNGTINAGGIRRREGLKIAVRHREGLGQVRRKT